MSTITKYASYNTVITTGWTNATNAYSEDNTNYATAAPGKGASITTDYGFAAFSTSDIPEGAKINSVTVTINWKNATWSTGSLIGLQIDNGGLLGTETTWNQSQATDTDSTKQETTGITLDNLRLADTVQARVRAYRATGGSTAVTFSLDSVRITIDFTPDGIGQALANIKAFNIQGYGQTQSLIRQTYIAYGQSQAYISIQVLNYGQAQAKISVSYYGYGQAQAHILSLDISQYAQTQTQIKTTYDGYGQSQGLIVYRLTNYGQSQSSIIGTYTRYGQSQARISKLWGFGQALAQLSRYNAYGLANARIILSPSYMYVSDTFTRTTSPGWGTADIGGDWVHSNNTYFSTNGTQGIITANTSINRLELKNTVPTTNKYYMEFIWSASSLPSESLGAVLFGLWDGGPNKGISGGLKLQPNGVFHIFCAKEGSSSSASTVGLGTYVAEETWRFKIEYYNRQSTSPLNTIRAKTWKDGTSEPDWIIYTSEYISSVSPQYFALDVDTENFTFTIDNLIITQFEHIYGQALALIDSSIKVSQGQTLAKINAFNVKAYGQARPRIKATIQSIGQSQAQILGESVTIYSSGQALGQILATYDYYGQSLGQVKQTYSDYAQAIGYIQKTEQGYAQTQSQIKQTYSSFAQALANIRSIDINVYAQVQAIILKTGIQAHAKAQARIGSEHLIWVKDTFTRTESNTWGISDSGHVWVDVNANLSVSSGVGHLVASQYNSLYWIYTNGSYEVFIDLKWSDYTTGWATIAEIDPGTDTNGQWRIRITNTNYISIGNRVQNVYNNSPFLFDNTKWYRVRIQHDKLDGLYNKTRAKIWPIDSPEPDWLVEYANSTTANWLYVYNWNNAGNIDVDNIYITQAYYLGFAQAQAEILSTAGTDNYGQSLALIGTTTALYSRIDEASIDDDDYIVAPYGTTYAEIALDPLPTPDFLIDHFIRVRALYASNAGATSLTVKLYEGTTQIAEFTPTLTTSFQTFAYELSGAEITSITDYSNLRLRFYSNERTIISWAEFQTPFGSGIKTRRVYAQALATILAAYTTYNTYGQAQAVISRTEQSYAHAQGYIIVRSINAYAQAMAHIIRTEQSYAQAQAQIRQTYQAFGQSQSIIKATYQSYGQSQAQIQQTYRGYAQALGLIRATYQSYGQALAQIKQTYQGYAQAQAQIKATYFVYAQSNAQIRQTYQGFGQSQAIIRVLNNNVYGNTQAQIKQAYQAYAQTQAQIKQAYYGYAQAQAQIKATYQQYGQSMARIKATYTSYGQALAQIKSTYQGYGQAQSQIRATYAGYAQAMAHIKVTNNYVYGQSLADIKQTYQVFAQAQGIIRTTNQVFAQAQAQIISTYQVMGQAQAQILATYQAYANAQSQILATYQGYAQAQAVILNAYQGYAQAQSKINAFNVVFHGQAAGWISGTALIYGQAQAKINAIAVKAYGQALADIKQTYQAYAQAMAAITGVVFGQSLATIRATYQVFAQSQATIRGNVFAQAMAAIRGNTFAQAQAYIKVTANNVYGQAQAQILQTYFGYAQTQAQVRATYAAYGQSLAQIRATYLAYGQAQAQILAMYQSYGQAQAQILQTYTQYGQAQSDIKTTYQSYAQAQATILNAYQGYAQAQAQVKQTYQVYGQSAAIILQTYAQYGQAQSLIVASYFGYAQALAHILVTANQVFGQSLATILTTNNGYSQSQAQIYVPQYIRPDRDISNGGWEGTVIN